MFEDYKNEVILDYKMKRKKGVLSSNLENPSPGQLRTECLLVYNERYAPNDEAILRLFFSSKNQEVDYSLIIERTDPDRFRPLQSILKEKIKEPKNSNIELLAWLIDFNPRPYSLWKKKLETEAVNEPLIHRIKSQEKEGKVDVKEIGGVKEIEAFTNPKVGNGMLDEEKKKEKKSKIRNVFISLAVLATTGSGIFFFLNKNQQCMYWTGEKYQPVSCNEKIDRSHVIAYDAQKVTHLKKITRPDTLTKNSIGKVWYIKVNGAPEFYTSGGEYPEDTRKRLLPVTSYILGKYVLQANRP